MSQPKILVVDDEPFICRSLTFVLKKGNFDVIEARDGEEALEAIRTHKPDLVFLDVMMPKVNGFEVTKQIRSDATFDCVKIILLTAKGQDCDREVGRESGANDYLTKPFSPTKILDRARQILGE